MAITYEYVGKAGGKVAVLDLSPDEPVNALTVNLPDGEWCIVVEMIRMGNSEGTLSIGGVLVARGQIYNASATGMHGLRRHMSGEVQITCSRFTIGTVTAFPDPTP